MSSHFGLGLASGKESNLFCQDCISVSSFGKHLLFINIRIFQLLSELLNYNDVN